MDGLLVKQVDCLRDACKSVRESQELLALFQVHTRTHPHTPAHTLHTPYTRPTHALHTLHTLHTPTSTPHTHTLARAPTGGAQRGQCLTLTLTLTLTLQVVLSVGNALNAGTGKGNAVGFKLSALLKLSDLKSSDKGDKKSTLLHFVVDVVRSNAPQIRKVAELLPIV
jgi:hypothetical protein